MRPIQTRKAKSSQREAQTKPMMSLVVMVSAFMPE